MNSDTLLIEVGTEELPPTDAKNLSDHFTDAVTRQLADLGFSHEDVTSYVTPRRIAVLFEQTSANQPDQKVERRGPAIDAAYDDDGQPTKAATGFARSCGVELEQLQTIDTDKGQWLFYKSTEKGSSLSDALPQIINQALDGLPIARPMRWGDSEVEFVRPIHWVVVMHGNRIVPAAIKNLTASNTTYGHRFHAPEPILLKHADDYAGELEQAKVIANFKQRRAAVNTLLNYAAEQHQGTLNFSDSLLDEVTNLVEWPMAVVGDYDAEFLAIPQEVLVATMQDAQRYFPLYSESGDALIPKFIIIANIESSNPETVKHGNERVIKPRFEDAKFFWMRDKEKSLASRGNDLEGILFEKQLGSVHDKVHRVASLVSYFCDQTGIPCEHALRATTLCKNDLLSSMVNEFPKLQGIMGRYYALEDGEPEEVATAIEEHYFPIQSGGQLPTTNAGKILALCDRIDTLMGIFATGKKPTGMKDPYALRRAALGVARITIECQLDYDLHELLNKSAELLQDKLDAQSVTDDVMDYILERLRGYFYDQGIPADTFEAVRNVQPTCLLDFAERIKAVEHFRKLPESESLAAANKRIRNILKKSSSDNLLVDSKLLKESAEQSLFKKITEAKEKISPLLVTRDYTAALSGLATLKPVVDKFFDEVMVMDEDEAIRANRVALLTKVNHLFTSVADISVLQS